MKNEFIEIRVKFVTEETQDLEEFKEFEYLPFYLKLSEILNFNECDENTITIRTTTDDVLSVKGKINHFVDFLKGKGCIFSKFEGNTAHLENKNESAFEIDSFLDSI